MLIQDAEARLAAAFSAGGTVSFAEQTALEAYDCDSSESESESEEEYDQADQGQAKMGHGVHMPAVPPQPPPPPPPPPTHVTPSRAYDLRTTAMTRASWADSARLTSLMAADARCGGFS